MKTIIAYLSILIIAITFTSCEIKDNFLEPDIELVPVYSITNIKGPNSLFKINIYKQKDLIIEYSSSVNAVSFSSNNYMDTSTDDTYVIIVDKMKEDKIINYAVTADKLTGQGTLTIDGAKTYDILISNDVIYN